jgi:hypothetical protein
MPSSTVLRILLLVVLGPLPGAPSASALVADADAPDTVTVKGQTLYGRVIQIGTETLEFETIYG